MSRDMLAELKAELAVILPVEQVAEQVVERRIVAVEQVLSHFATARKGH